MGTNLGFLTSTMASIRSPRLFAAHLLIKWGRSLLLHSVTKEKPPLPGPSLMVPLGPLSAPSSFSIIGKMDPIILEFHPNGDLSVYSLSTPFPSWRTLLGTFENRWYREALEGSMTSALSIKIHRTQSRLRLDLLLIPLSKRTSSS